QQNAVQMRTDRKHRVTFRIAPDLAAALRTLPSQTAFVEAALREALGRTCPLCSGRGRVSAARMRVSDFKQARLPRLGRAEALRLRDVVRMGRRLHATDLDLASAERGALAFQLSRQDQVLCRGRVRGADDVTLEKE